MAVIRIDNHLMKVEKEKGTKRFDNNSKYDNNNPSVINVNE